MSVAHTVKNLKPTLIGDRTTIRLISTDDIELIRTWRNQESIRQNFLNSNIIAPKDQQIWFSQYAKSPYDYMYIIEETLELRSPIGALAIYNIDTSNNTAEFGRLMLGNVNAQGKGLALESTKLVLNYWFSAEKLRSVYLKVLKRNERAIGLYHKLGFEIKTEELDLLHMELTSQKWLIN